MRRDELGAPTDGRLVIQERGLLCRLGGSACLVPLVHVVETMRPLPIRALVNASPFVAGVAIVRGVATMVVDAARLLGAPGADHTASRFVLLRVGPRRIALAVGEVVGIRELPSSALAALPPLLRAISTEAVETIGTLDDELVVVLRAAKLVPDAAWATLESAPS